MEEDIDSLGFSVRIFVLLNWDTRKRIIIWLSGW